jgi:hypothetical protein
MSEAINPCPFTKAVAGVDTGVTTNDNKRSLRIQRNAENKHLLVAGRTGSSKFERHPARR